jgi:AcrR family transcriptional regulator
MVLARHTAPSQLDPAERKAEILRTAAENFCAKGFHGTSMSEIAKAVGLTKAGLYYYVEGKEELLFSIVTSGMDRLEAWIEAAKELPEPASRLRHVLESHAAAITEDGSAITLLVNEVEALSDNHRARIERRQRGYFDFVRATLVALQERGQLTDVDPTVAAFGVLGSVLWVARWYRTNGRLSGEEVANQIASLALRGVLKKDSP